MFKDLTGKKFGRLEVLYRDFDNPKSNVRTYWMCKCDCGNKVSVAAQSLLRKTNKTESCGCIRKENNAKLKKTFKKVDMIGKRFGRLTVIKESKQKSGKRQKLMYDCICDCGNNHTVCGETLRSGETKSCGCIYIETRGEASKNYNTYDLNTYEYGVGYCDNGTHFFFDKEDYYKIKNYSWWYDGKYVTAHSLKDDKYTTKIIRMHRVVMNIEDRENVNVDHKNLVRYDCRKSNLRIATDVENARNKRQSYCTPDNPVGIYKINDNRYDVYILKKFRGSFDNFIDAIKFRQQLEIDEYGDFRYNPEQQKIIEIDIESRQDSLLLCSNE
jgi:hypothetical protein